MSLFGTGSIFNHLTNGKGATLLTISVLIITAVTLISRVTSLNVFAIMKKIVYFIFMLASKVIRKSELKYHRDIEIGKLDDKMKRVKIYRFLNDLIIDLGLKQMGATPYEFLFLTLLGSLVVTLILCKSLFGSILMSIILFPIMFSGIVCVLYTKANISHETRIENVIESENILCSNIKDGVVVAVRNSLNVIPLQVREVFRDFLDNIEHKNYHIRTALLELNQQLGVVAEDFIKKCIVFELEEERGIVGMFKDIVELNNIKMKMRTEMKREFEKVVADFIVGASMIFVFLGGVIAIFPDVSHFYLRTPIGQIIIAFDALLMIGEFVYITYLRAKEL